jgi:gamma-glutamyltranspeptidase/glutathione hydrolase
LVSAPLFKASEAGAAVLREGGTAIEAAIAMAAMLAVVYPHMTGIGGDAFWIVASPGQKPIAIDGAGPAAAGATIDLFERAGEKTIPWRGPLAANTIAGAVSSWSAALEISNNWKKSPGLGLTRLLQPAIDQAESGIIVSESQAALTNEKWPELCPVPGFTETFALAGQPPGIGAKLRLPALARTLRRLAEEGLDSFYRGDLATDLAYDLEAAGTPLRSSDLFGYQAKITAPLTVGVSGATLFNQPPPTQGLSSLMILALFDRLSVTEGESFAHLHGLIEATKQAFIVRDREIADPGAMRVDPSVFLEDAYLDDLAKKIDMRRASIWPGPASAGDTTWFGAIDAQGGAASVIQSIYFEFGSGLVLPQTGVTWQNRGASFSLDRSSRRALAPGNQPFHTLNPALARFTDGRIMAYGTMGGEGQPQTQAALFSRYAWFGASLQQAITAPRWLLGRTWGEETVALKLEDRFPKPLIAALREAGHEVELVAPFTGMMGHAGAVVRHPDGSLEGGSDPRSDGAALETEIISH